MGELLVNEMAERKPSAIAGTATTGMNDRMEIAKRLIKARALTDIKVHTAAKRAKTSKSYLMKLESGESLPGLDVLNRLCLTYSVLPEMILFADYEVVRLEGNSDKGSKHKIDIKTMFLNASKSRWGAFLSS